MTKIADLFQMNAISHSVRRSQAVLQYGVGAMIDFPSQVLMTALPEEWRGVEVIHDERLEKLLGVKHFISPSESGIPFVRFPRWYFCPQCRRFQSIEQWQKEYAVKGKRKGDEKDPYMIERLRCSKDNQELVPARIVTVCAHGHIDDFPWVKWVHCKNRFGEKEVCTTPQLLFKTGSSASSGLEGVELECTGCGAKASLFGAFNPDIFSEIERTSKFGTLFVCSGKHPWKNESESCFEYPRSIQRGAASVYFPRIISSLVIPPYSDYLNERIENSETLRTLTAVINHELKKISADSEKEEITNNLIEEYAPELSAEIREDENSVKAVLKRKLLPTQGYEESADRELQYKAEEYKALSGAIPANNFAKDEFKREITETDLYNIKGVKSIALIHKVKEVTALIGFSRIQPTNAMDNKDEIFVSVKKPSTCYYPATIAKGEGIFIEFDRELLEKFFNTKIFSNRAKALNERYNNSFYGQNNYRHIDSAFLFLHTMAHLLIKELSFNCGYPTASIRERIYYGKAEGEDMCGIFIYTTGGDSEGTLGGLVRQGYSDCLPGVFSRALKAAKFCANDPVCSFSEGQGIEALNYAACHTCTLLPETCCEYSNTLLDRTLIKGNMDGSIKGFYS